MGKGLSLILLFVLILSWQVDAEAKKKKRPCRCKPNPISCSRNKKDIIGSQSQSSANANQQTTSAPTESSVQSDIKDKQTTKNVGEGFKTIVEGSRVLNGWSLIIIAASIAAIVSTSYIRPHNKRIRAIYLLFLPGWILLSWSVYYGDAVSRRYMAALMISDEKNLKQIGESINSDFSSQITLLQFGLLFFAVWLFWFLCWWVFGDWSIGKTKA